MILAVVIVLAWQDTRTHKVKDEFRNIHCAQQHRGCNTYGTEIIFSPQARVTYNV